MYKILIALLALMLISTDTRACDLCTVYLGIQPNDFKPERWASSGCPMHGNHKPEAMKVFGGGARFCPGKILAIHEMKMAIAMICHNFDFVFDTSPDDVNEIAAFTMYPENLNIRLEQRVLV